MCVWLVDCRYVCACVVGGTVGMCVCACVVGGTVGMCGRWTVGVCGQWNCPSLHHKI